MELARLNLKLSGDPANVIVLNDVTPPQLAVYAYMHGEDCVQSLVVTSIDKKRDHLEEINRIREIFMTDNAKEAVNKLFPGMNPGLPTTFHSLGYDPEMLNQEFAAVKKEENTRSKSSDAAAAIQKKIKAAAAQRKASGTEPIPVTKDDLQDELDAEDAIPDDPLDPDDDDSHDPIDDEMDNQDGE